MKNILYISLISLIGFLYNQSANAEVLLKNAFGCQFYVENEQQKREYIQTSKFDKLSGLAESDFDKYYLKQFCELSPNSKILFKKHPKITDANDTASVLVSEKNSETSFIRYAEIKGCPVELEMWQKGSKFLNEIKYKKSCFESNNTISISESFCHTLKDVDARMACLNKPYETNNLDARNILTGNCYGVSKNIRELGLSEVCDTGVKACGFLKNSKHVYSCQSCQGTKQWAAIYATGTILQCNN